MLKNCPYGCSLPFSVQVRLVQTKIGWCVECTNCKVRGPERPSAQQAVEAWNAVSGAKLMLHDSPLAESERSWSAWD